MQIFIHRDDQEFGPYSEYQIKGFLADGNVSGEDLCRVDDDPELNLLRDRLGNLFATKSASIVPPPPPRAAKSESFSIVDTVKLMRRYSDAYFIVRWSVTLGHVIEFVGFILGSLIAVGGICLSGDNAAYYNSEVPNPNPGRMILIGSILLGIGTALAFFLLGILVRASGQLLMACLDIAVNSSPFLRESQKASIMKID